MCTLVCLFKSTYREFSYDSSSDLNGSKSNHIQNKCKAFHQYVLACMYFQISSLRAREITCMCRVFQYVLSYDSSNETIESKSNHIECICKAFLQYEPSNDLIENKSNHIECICKVFLQYMLSYDPSKYIIESKSNHFTFDVGRPGPQCVTSSFSLQ